MERLQTDGRLPPLRREPGVWGLSRWGEAVVLNRGPHGVEVVENVGDDWETVARCALPGEVHVSVADGDTLWVGALGEVFALRRR